MAWLMSWTFHVILIKNIASGFILESFSGHQTIFNSTTTSTNTQQHTEEHLTRLHWANSAFDYIQSLNCSEMYFTSQRECNHLLNVRKRNVAVYTAQTSSAEQMGNFVAMLPDSGLSRGGTHHGVIALDPHPDANFGHLVVVFFIDKSHNTIQCERRQGIYIGNGECMKLALKHRCKNAIERRRRNDESEAVMSARLRRKMVRRCEINFLPLVHPYTEVEPEIVDGISQGYEQHLLCREDLVEFSLCPELRPANETLNLVCNPIRDNTRRCETSHEAVGTTCGMFETCDQAVLISGGWNRQTSVTRHSQNIVNMYHLLRRNGFQERGTKIFFANGMHRGIQEETGADSVNTEVFPAAMKTAMRLHIQRLCQTSHCVDSLVLYLNSPSKTDGTMLLWDVNKNGKAEDDEQYTVDELLSDIKSCKARSIQIIADQSFSGEISRAIRKSDYHDNVYAFASGKENEYSYLSTFTDHWTRMDHSHMCSIDAFQQVKSTMLLSTPDLGTKSHRPNGGSEALTLFGAPCNVDPPFSSNELKLWYRGCQNVPMEVWIRTFFAPASSPGLTSSSHSEVEEEEEDVEIIENEPPGQSEERPNRSNSNHQENTQQIEENTNNILSNSVNINPNHPRVQSDESGLGEESTVSTERHANSIPTT